MKPYIAKCKVCGDIEIDSPYTDVDGGVIIPVACCPTLQSFCKTYKEELGATFFQNTGNKPSEVVEKKFLRLTHLVIEDTSEEARQIHTLGKIECWTDNP